MDLNYQVSFLTSVSHIVQEYTGCSLSQTEHTHNLGTVHVTCVPVDGMYIGYDCSGPDGIVGL